MKPPESHHSQPETKPLPSTEERDQALAEFARSHQELTQLKTAAEITEHDELQAMLIKLANNNLELPAPAVAHLRKIATLYYVFYHCEAPVASYSETTHLLAGEALQPEINELGEALQGAPFTEPWGIAYEDFLQLQNDTTKKTQ
ncbi:MAG TPA: hypothetical protein VFZ58_05535 [Candidatus Saccharimonadales bacterium]